MTTVESRIIMARATCNMCAFVRTGRAAPEEAVEHARESGHHVTLNTHTFTIIKGDMND